MIREAPREAGSSLGKLGERHDTVRLVWLSGAQASASFRSPFAFNLIGHLRRSRATRMYLAATSPCRLSRPQVRNTAHLLRSVIVDGGHHVDAVLLIRLRGRQLTNGCGQGQSQGDTCKAKTKASDHTGLIEDAWKIREPSRGALRIRVGASPSSTGPTLRISRRGALLQSASFFTPSIKSGARMPRVIQQDRHNADSQRLHPRF